MATGSILRMVKKANAVGDLMETAEGKTQVSTKEGGLFEVSKNDDVAAGPGILDKLKSKAKLALKAINRFPVSESNDLIKVSEDINPATKIIENNS